MEVGEQRRLWAKEPDLDRLRLLDAQDQVRLAPYVLDRHDPRALRLVLSVANRAALARSLLDQDLVPVLGQLPGPHRRQRHAVLVGLDLGGNADLHETPLAAA